MAAQRVDYQYNVHVQALNWNRISVWVAHLVLSSSPVILVQNSIITNRHYIHTRINIWVRHHLFPLPVLEGRG